MPHLLTSQGTGASWALGPGPNAPGTLCRFRSICPCGRLSLQSGIWHRCHCTPRVPSPTRVPAPPHVPAPLRAVQPGQRRCCRQLGNRHPARTSISHVLNCLQNGNLNLLLVLPNSLSPPIFPCLSDTLRSNRNRDFSGNVIYFP